MIALWSALAGAATLGIGGGSTPSKESTRSEVSEYLASGPLAPESHRDEDDGAEKAHKG